MSKIWRFCLCVSCFLPIFAMKRKPTSWLKWYGLTLRKLLYDE